MKRNKHTSEKFKFGEVFDESLSEPQVNKKRDLYQESKLVMTLTTIQFRIPFAALVEAIKSLQPIEKIALKKILDEDITLIPLDNGEQRNPLKVKQTAEQLGKAVERLLAETGMTEDEFADLFDMSKPFPYEIGS